MPELRYGKLASWDDADVSSQNDFMTLVEGDNVVRVFSNPFQFHVAWIKDASGANRKLRSAVKNCPLVKAGHKVQTRWYLGVLDRKSGQPKIIEISSQAYKGIKDYYSDEDWGDVRGYDINIKRGPKGSQPLYTVLAKPKSKLTDEEKALITKFNERVDIGKFTQPPSTEEVAEKLAEAMGGAVDTGARYAVGQQTVENTGAGVKPTVSDEDFDFGDED